MEMLEISLICPNLLRKSNPVAYAEIKARQEREAMEAVKQTSPERYAKIIAIQKKREEREAMEALNKEKKAYASHLAREETARAKVD